MTYPLVKATWQWLQYYDQPNLSDGGSYLLAVSGGVDSMCLLHVFIQLREKQGISFAVSHINHQLREASKEEEEMVRTYCRAHDVPLTVSYWEKPVTGNLEAEARAFRYETFGNLLKKQGIRRLVTAHQRDDVVETFLMRLIHGSSLAHVTGLHPVSTLYTYKEAEILRPFFSVAKEDLYGYAESCRIPYREDESNQDTSYTRNRLRHQIIPQLEEEDPKVKDHLYDFVADFQGTGTLTEEYLQTEAKSLGERTDRGFSIDVSRFQSYDKDSQIPLLQLFFDQTGVEALEHYGRKGLEEVQNLLTSQRPQGEISLPEGYTLRRTYDKAYIEREVVSPAPVLRQALSLKAGDHAKVGKAGEILRQVSPPSSVYQQMLILPENFSEKVIIIRHRKAGDYLFLKSGKRQKLRRFFINEKIASEERERAVLVVTEEQEVLGLFLEDGQRLYAHHHPQGKEKLFFHFFS